MAERPEGVSHGAQRQRKVGAGITIGHREDIDAIELFPTRGDPVRRRVKSAGESRSIEISDADGHQPSALCDDVDLHFRVNIVVQPDAD